jgi:hypothetical protein
VSDFATGAEYARLIEQLAAGEITAHDAANACLERDETYHAYVFLLIAADQDDEDALDEADMLREVDQVCDEDVHLAELQVALWYRRGHVVQRDLGRALAHLPFAAFPFLELPSAEEIASAPDVTAFRDRAWNAAVGAYGIPASPDSAAIDAVLAKIFDDAGWPPTLDITLPLGPSLPYRPHHLHDRHAIG